MRGTDYRRSDPTGRATADTASADNAAVPSECSASMHTGYTSRADLTKQLFAAQEVIHTSVTSRLHVRHCSSRSSAAALTQRCPSVEPANPASPPPLKVLLFDDSDLCLAFSGEVLSRAGFAVRGAHDLAEFDGYLSEWSPDVILADVKMPDIDGAALCRFLKQGFRTAHLPVVLFSNIEDKALAEIAASCGADAYLSKDGGFDSLPTAISSLCEEILW